MSALGNDDEDNLDDGPTQHLIERGVKQMLYERACGMSGLDGFLAGFLGTPEEAERVANQLRSFEDPDPQQALKRCDLVWLFEEYIVESGKKVSWSTMTNRITFTVRRTKFKRLIQRVWTDPTVKVVSFLVDQLGFDPASIQPFEQPNANRTMLLNELLQAQNHRRAPRLRLAPPDNGSRSHKDGEFAVSCLIDRRIARGTPQYLIRWKGFSWLWDCWEPLDNLYCTELIQAYERALQPSIGSLPSPSQSNARMTKRSRHTTTRRRSDHADDNEAAAAAAASPSNIEVSYTTDEVEEGGETNTAQTSISSRSVRAKRPAATASRLDGTGEVDQQPLKRAHWLTGTNLTEQTVQIPDEEPYRIFSTSIDQNGQINCVAGWIDPPLVLVLDFVPTSTRSGN